MIQLIGRTVKRTVKQTFQKFNFTLAKKFTAASVALSLLYTSAAVPVLQANLWEQRKVARNQNAQESQRRDSYTQLASAAGYLQEGFSSSIDNLLPESSKPSLSIPMKDQAGPSGAMSRAAVNSGNLPAPLLAVPYSYGEVFKVHVAKDPSAPFVLLIQDAHQIESAQRNVAQTLSHLQAKLGRRLFVGLEGSTGAFDIKQYRQLKNPKIQKEIWEVLIQKSLINGAEYFGLMAEKEPLLWGVEDEALYLNNVAAYRKGLEAREQTAEMINALEAELAAIKTKLLTPELARLDSLEAKFGRHEIGLADYIQYFEGSPELNSGRYPEIDKYLSLARVEKDLDFKSIETQRNELIKILSKKLQPAELNQLLQMSVSYRLGRIGYAEYYRSLQAMLQNAKIDLKQYKGFNAYVQYVLMSERIDFGSLISNLEGIENAAVRRLAQTAEQKNAVEYSAQLRLAAKLTRQELSPEDWDSYRARRNEIARLPENVALLSDIVKTREKSVAALALQQPMKNAGRALKLARSDGHAPNAAFAELIAVHEAFYAASHDRNAALTENFSAKLKESSSQFGVLIAGGFHTPGLQKEFESRGMSYALFRPRIGKVSGAGTDYLHVFAPDRTPIEKMLLGERLFLMPRSATSERAYPGMVDTTALLKGAVVPLQAALGAESGDAAAGEANASQIAGAGVKVTADGGGIYNVSVDGQGDKTVFLGGEVPAELADAAPLAFSAGTKNHPVIIITVAKVRRQMFGAASAARGWGQSLVQSLDARVPNAKLLAVSAVSLVTLSYAFRAPVLRSLESLVAFAIFAGRSPFSNAAVASADASVIGVAAILAGASLAFILAKSHKISSGARIALLSAVVMLVVACGGGKPQTAVTPSAGSSATSVSGTVTPAASPTPTIAPIIRPQATVQPIPLPAQAQATFNGIKSMIEPKTGLLVDKVAVNANNQIEFRQQDVDYMKTSPTNIGLGLTSVIIARDSNWISAAEADAMIGKMIGTLEKMETLKLNGKETGLWFNWYDLSKVGGNGAPAVTLNRFVSTVDNGNLTAGLMVARAAVSDPALAGRIQKLIDAQQYAPFVNSSNGLMNHGWDEAKKSFSPYDYGTFNTEARLTAAVAVSLGAPRTVWDNMSREALSVRLKDGSEALVIAPWGGSLFEALFPNLFLDEKSRDPNGLGKNHSEIVGIHIDRAAANGIWGWSPAQSAVTNIYGEFGVPELGYRGGSKGYPIGSASPYSLALAYPYAPQSAMSALDAMRKANGIIYDDAFGYRDSIDPVSGRAANDVLGLDKGIELAGFDAAQNQAQGQQGAVAKYFSSYMAGAGKGSLIGDLFSGESARIQAAEQKFLELQQVASLKPSELARSFEFIKSSIETGDWYTPGQGIVSRSAFNDAQRGSVNRIQFDVSGNGWYNGTYYKQNIDPQTSILRYVVVGARAESAATNPGSFKVEVKGSKGTLTFVVDGLTTEWKDFVFPMQDVGLVNEVVTTFEYIRADPSARKGVVLVSDISLASSARQSLAFAPKTLSGVATRYVFGIAGKSGFFGSGRDLPFASVSSRFFGVSGAVSLGVLTAFFGAGSASDRLSDGGVLSLSPITLAVALTAFVVAAAAGVIAVLRHIFRNGRNRPPTGVGEVEVDSLVAFIDGLGALSDAAFQEGLEKAREKIDALSGPEMNVTDRALKAKLDASDAALKSRLDQVRDLIFARGAELAHQAMRGSRETVRKEGVFETPLQEVQRVRQNLIRWHEWALAYGEYHIRRNPEADRENVQKYGKGIIDEINRDMFEPLLEAVDQIEDNVRRGVTAPDKVQLKLSRNDGRAPSVELERNARIGFLPMKGDPWQVGHIYVMLKAIAKGELDKVVVMVDDSDSVRKPNLSSLTIREPITRELLRELEPFIEYTPISREEADLRDADGETSLFLLGRMNAEIGRIRDLNLNKKIQWFYLVGSDHRHWDVIRNGVRVADTPQKIVLNMGRHLFGFDGNEPGIVFVERVGEEFAPGEIEELKKKSGIENIIAFKGTMDTSSTRVRESKHWWTVPFDIFLMAQMFEFWNSEDVADERIIEKEYWRDGNINLISIVPIELSSDDREKIRFGTAGWRAKFPSSRNPGGDFSPDRVRLLMQSAAEYVIENIEAFADAGLVDEDGRPVVVIGYDHRDQGLHPESGDRLSEKAYAQDAARIFAANGVRVKLMRRAASTPLNLYEMWPHNGAKAAMMVNFTASHNPSTDGGVEFFDGRTGGLADSPVSDPIVARLRDANAIRSVKVTSMRNPLIERIEPSIDEYVNYLTDVIGVSAEDIRKSGINALFDAQNGVVGGVAREIIDRLGISQNVTIINGESDPEFGGRKNSEITADNLKETMSRVRAEKRDAAVTGDGDFDRSGLMAPKADGSVRLYNGNDLASVQVYGFLKSEKEKLGDDFDPSKYVVVRSIVSTAWVDAIAASFGVPQENIRLTAVGFRFLNNEIRQAKEEGKTVILSFEENGGIALGSALPYKDGLASTLYALTVAARAKLNNQTMEDLFQAADAAARRPDYGRYDVEVEAAEAGVQGSRGMVMQKFEAAQKEFQAAIERGEQPVLGNTGLRVIKTETMDGYYYRLADAAGKLVGWVNVRASGTEPLFRIYVETVEETPGSARINQQVYQWGRDIIWSVVGSQHTHVKTVGDARISEDIEENSVPAAGQSVAAPADLAPAETGLIDMSEAQRSRWDRFKLSANGLFAGLLVRIPGKNPLTDKSAIASANRIDHDIPAMTPDNLVAAQSRSIPDILSALPKEDLALVADFSGGISNDQYDSIQSRPSNLPRGEFAVKPVEDAIVRRLQGQEVDIVLAAGIASRLAALTNGGPLYAFRFANVMDGPIEDFKDPEIHEFLRNLRVTNPEFGDLTDTDMPYGARIMIARRFELARLADRVNERLGEPRYNFADVLDRQKIIFHVNEESGPDIISDLARNHFYGFNPANIVFMIQDVHNTWIFDAETGQVVRPDESHIRPFGHGNLPYDEATPGIAFRMTLDQDSAQPVYRQEFIEQDALSYMMGQGAQTYAVEELADLNMLVHPLKLDQSVAAEVLFNEGHNMIGRAADNVTQQKGGFVLQRKDNGQHVIIEGPEIADPAYDGLLSADSVPRLNFWGFRGLIQPFRNAIQASGSPFFNLDVRPNDAGEARLALDTYWSNVTMLPGIDYHSVYFPGEGGNTFKTSARVPALVETYRYFNQSYSEAYPGQNTSAAGWTRWRSPSSDGGAGLRSLLPLVIFALPFAAIAAAIAARLMGTDSSTSADFGSPDIMVAGFVSAVSANPLTKTLQRGWNRLTGGLSKASPVALSLSDLPPVAPLLSDLAGDADPAVARSGRVLTNLGLLSAGTRRARGAEERLTPAELRRAVGRIVYGNAALSTPEDFEDTQRALEDARAARALELLLAERQEQNRDESRSGSLNYAERLAFTAASFERGQRGAAARAAAIILDGFDKERLAQNRERLTEEWKRHFLSVVTDAQRLASEHIVGDVDAAYQIVDGRGAVIRSEGFLETAGLEIGNASSGRSTWLIVDVATPERALAELKRIVSEQIAAQTRSGALSPGLQALQIELNKAPSERRVQVVHAGELRQKKAAGGVPLLDASGVIHVREFLEAALGTLNQRFDPSRGVQLVTYNPHMLDVSGLNSQQVWFVLWYSLSAVFKINASSDILNSIKQSRIVETQA